MLRPSKMDKTKCCISMGGNGVSLFEVLFVNLFSPSSFPNGPISQFICQLFCGLFKELSYRLN